jgi:hypothetical protein
MNAAPTNAFSLDIQGIRDKAPQPLNCVRAEYYGQPPETRRS